MAYLPSTPQDVASVRRHDTMPLAYDAAQVPPASTQAVALGLSDVKEFFLVGYPGFGHACVYELLRAGAPDAWAEDRVTGLRLTEHSVTMQMHNPGQWVRMFYRAPVVMILCPACDEIRPDYSAQSPYCTRCDGVQPDGVSFRHYAPTSTPAPYAGPYQPQAPFPGYDKGQPVQAVTRAYDGVWSSNQR